MVALPLLCLLLTALAGAAAMRAPLGWRLPIGAPLSAAPLFAAAWLAACVPLRRSAVVARPARRGFGRTTPGLRLQGMISRPVGRFRGRRG